MIDERDILAVEAVGEPVRYDGEHGGPWLVEYGGALRADGRRVSRGERHFQTREAAEAWSRQVRLLSPRERTTP